MTRTLAVATLALAVALAVILPGSLDLPPGWRTPVMALELARSPGELAFLAGPEAAGARDAMRAGHLVDLLFPLAYGGLLVAVGSLYRTGVARVAGGIAIGADWAENAVILWLLSRLGDGVTAAEPGLPLLFATTWTKWSAIAIGFAALGARVRRTRPLVATVLFAAAIPVPLAASTGLPALGELMGLAVIAGFGAVMVLSEARNEPREAAR